MQSNIKDKVVFASPKNEEERAFLAGACLRKLALKFPAVLDEFGNSTERAYTGWPDCLYLIDAQGRIAYKEQARTLRLQARRPFRRAGSASIDCLHALRRRLCVPL